MTSTGRYPRDVLAPGWQRAGRPTSTELVLQVGLVLEDARVGILAGRCCAGQRGLLVLEERHGTRCAPQATSNAPLVTVVEQLIDFVTDDHH